MQNDIPLSRLIQLFLEKSKFVIELHPRENLLASAIEWNIRDKVLIRSENMIDFKYLLDKIYEGNEIEFANALRKIEKQNTFHVDMLSLLLKDAIITNSIECINVLLENSLKHSLLNNKNCNGNQPLFLALSYGRYEIVKTLLKYENVEFAYENKKWNVLHQICATTSYDNSCDMHKCFDLIIRDRRCTREIINALDIKNYSPLTYACENEYDEIAKELIKRGAYIHKSITPHLKENILSECLDDCVSHSGVLNDRDCAVQFNYQFLIPPKGGENSSIRETRALKCIAKNSKLKHLVTHPLFKSYIDLKWKRVNFLIYFALLVYFIFLLYLSHFILEFFQHEIYRKNMTNVSNSTKAQIDSDKFCAPQLPPICNCNFYPDSDYSNGGSAGGFGGGFASGGPNVDYPDHGYAYEEEVNISEGSGFESGGSGLTTDNDEETRHEKDKENDFDNRMTGFEDDDDDFNSTETRPFVIAPISTTTPSVHWRSSQPLHPVVLSAPAPPAQPENSFIAPSTNAPDATLTDPQVNRPTTTTRSRPISTSRATIIHSTTTPSRPRPLSTSRTTTTPQTTNSPATILPIIPHNSAEIKPVVVPKPTEKISILRELFGKRRRRRDVSSDNETMSEQMKTERISYIKSHANEYRACIIGIALIAIYEIIELIMSGRYYFTKLSNWLDCMLLGLAYAIFVESFTFDPTTFQRMRAVLFLLIASQSFLLAAKVSTLSFQLEIFKKVAKTFIKFIMLYSVLIFAFALSFYTIYENSIDGNDDENDDKKAFGTIFISSITIVRMMLSDFENIKLTPDDQFHAVIFLIFMVFITGILFNLMNALAINDTQELMKETEVLETVKRVTIMNRCEKMLAVLNIYCFNVFTSLIPLGSIIIKPNCDNVVYIRGHTLEKGKLFVKYTPIITTYLVKWSYLRNFATLTLNEETIDKVKVHLAKQYQKERDSKIYCI